jgi:hypothetical protein
LAGRPSACAAAARIRMNAVDDGAVLASGLTSGTVTAT